MISETFADLRAHGLRLDFHCWNCARWRQANLDAIIAEGRGGEVYVGRKPRCSTCGELGTMQIRPGVSPVGTG